MAGVAVTHSSSAAHCTVHVFSREQQHMTRVAWEVCCQRDSYVRLPWKMVLVLPSIFSFRLGFFFGDSPGTSLDVRKYVITKC